MSLHAKLKIFQKINDINLKLNISYLQLKAIISQKSSNFSEKFNKLGVCYSRNTYFCLLFTNSNELEYISSVSINDWTKHDYSPTVSFVFAPPFTHHSSMPLCDIRTSFYPSLFKRPNTISAHPFTHHSQNALMRYLYLLLPRLGDICPKATSVRKLN